MPEPGPHGTDNQETESGHGAPIAFLVQAHQDPVHVRRLVERLRPHHAFIHLDAKTEMNEEWRSIPATFIEPRVPVYWAGYTQVEATLNTIKAALATGTRYSKLVLLSGACYPIRPMAELEALFASDGGHNYVRYVDVRTSPHLMTLISHRYVQDAILPWEWTSRWRSLARLEKILRKSYTSTVGKLKDPWTLPLVPCHGSNWWVLSHEAAAECIATLARNPAIESKYRRSFASDEQVFHTIIANSEYAAKATGFMPYTGRGTYKAANLHVIHPSLTKWFTIEDFDSIMSTDKFFVRKVGTAMSTPLLDAIDRAVDQKREFARLG